MVVEVVELPWAQLVLELDLAERRAQPPAEEGVAPGPRPGRTAGPAGCQPMPLPLEGVRGQGQRAALVGPIEALPVDHAAVHVQASDAVGQLLPVVPAPSQGREVQPGTGGQHALRHPEQRGVGPDLDEHVAAERGPALRRQGRSARPLGRGGASRSGRSAPRRLLRR